MENERRGDKTYLMVIKHLEKYIDQDVSKEKQIE